MLDVCDQEDRAKEAEIKARNDEKEIEAWYNQPRYHDKKLLREAKDVIEEEFLKKIRDERRRMKAYDIFEAVFKDLNSFKKELSALAKGKKVRTEELKQLYVPNTVSWTTYYHALDTGATLDVEVSDLVGPKPTITISAKLKKQESIKLEKEFDDRVKQYINRARKMVKETGMIKEEEELNPEERALRKKRCKT